MPTYTYTCRACGHDLEQHQPITDQPLTHCPNCHTNQLRRTPNAIGITFKGTGFYRTDAA